MPIRITVIRVSGCVFFDKIQTDSLEEMTNPSCIHGAGVVVALSVVSSCALLRVCLVHNRFAV